MTASTEEAIKIVRNFLNHLDNLQQLSADNKDWELQREASKAYTYLEHFIADFNQLCPTVTKSPKFRNCIRSRMKFIDKITPESYNLNIPG